MTAARSLSFSIPTLPLSLNRWQRMHWAERAKFQKLITMEIIAAIGGPLYYPRPRMERAIVTIIRHSSRLLDEDNPVVKPFVDALTATHGIGIVADDNPNVLRIIVKQVKCKRVDAHTEFLIEEMTCDLFKEPAA